MAEPSGRERAESLEAADVLTDARIVELIHEIEGLHAAMEHRAVIEQAKGVIMNVMGCGPDAAFAVLVFQSQHQNRKLRDIAAEIAGAQDRASESNWPTTRPRGSAERPRDLEAPPGAHRQ